MDLRRGRLDRDRATQTRARQLLGRDQLDAGLGTGINAALDAETKKTLAPAPRCATRVSPKTQNARTLVGKTTPCTN
eukprot:11193739-Lingulodinium_polyedra.AAC.1